MSKQVEFCWEAGRIALFNWSDGKRVRSPPEPRQWSRQFLRKFLAERQTALSFSSRSIM